MNIGVPQGSILQPLLFMRTQQCGTAQLALLTILLIQVISCHLFSLLMTPQNMFNMVQLMVQIISLTRN